MVQVKVEHVIVVLLGLFLLYHFMGSCGCNRVEGWITLPDNYKYQTPYVQEDSQYCGISDAYQKYYDDTVLLNNQPPGSALLTLKNNRDTAQAASVKADADYDAAKSVSDRSASAARQHRQTPKPTPHGSLQANLWQEQQNRLDTAAGEDATNTAAALDAKTAAATNLANAQDALTKGSAEFLDKINQQYNIRQRLCDKPNRMLLKYGPQHACENNGGLVLATPDMNFWTDTEVKKYMTYDSEFDGTTVSKEFPSCEIKNSAGKDTTLIARDGPFHGYSFAPGTVARYESGERHQEDPNAVNKQSLVGLF
jgi:hypothetical protein